MAGPPFPSQIVPISHFCFYLPDHCTVLGAESCVGYLNLILFYFIFNLPAKKAGGKTQWVARNLRPLDFIGLDISPRTPQLWCEFGNL
jgi:hypothetical protein